MRSLGRGKGCPCRAFPVRGRRRCRLHGGLSDLPELDLKSEEPEALVGDPVEPIECRTVLLGEAGGDPDDGYCLKPRRVGQELPEVAVVRSLKLVLYQHPAIGPNLLAEDVGAEGSDVTFLRLQLELHAQRFAQHGQVLSPREPRREVRGLADPDVAQLDALESTEVVRSYTPAAGSVARTLDFVLREPYKMLRLLSLLTRAALGRGSQLVGRLLSQPPRSGALSPDRRRSRS